MNSVTRFLLAAAHLDNERIYRDLKERYIDRNYKLTAPEVGVDITLLIEEAKKGRIRIVKKNIVILLLLGAITLAYKMFPFNIIVGLLIAWPIELYFSIAQKYYVRKKFLSPTLLSDKKDDYVTNQNVIVYGGFSPFLGSGKNVSGWSFAIDLTNKDEKAKQIQSISISELYLELDSAIDKLSIDNLVSADQLFIFGADVEVAQVERDENLVPKAIVELDAVKKYRGECNPLVRHYKVYRVAFSGGEMVLSVYIRFAKIGEYLFVESSSFLLPPLYDELKTVQKMRTTTAISQFVVIALTAFFKATVTWIISLLWLLSKSNYFFKYFEETSEKKEVQNNPRYNYGWNESLREKWSKEFFDRYFQILDNDMFLKVLEKRLLDAIVQSLKARGIATDLLKERESVIINEGVMVSGGSIQADSLTVGKGAMSSYAKKMGFKKGVTSRDKNT